jgi:hypothetical protein
MSTILGTIVCSVVRGDFHDYFLVVLIVGTIASTMCRLFDMILKYPKIQDTHLILTSCFFATHSSSI